jgi:septum formation protein
MAAESLSESTLSEPTLSVENIELVLASGSPRRRDILAQLDLRFRVEPADIDESEKAGEPADVYVRRLAETKAATVAHRLATTSLPNTPNARTVVLAADTTVSLDGNILGKPNDNDDALRMLTSLQGRTHETYTGIAVSVDGATISDVVKTSVTFGELDAETIAWYVRTGEPIGKAGSYAIQGIAGSFVHSITGNLQNVIGLPMVQTMTLLSNFGFHLSNFRS